MNRKQFLASVFAIPTAVKKAISKTSTLSIDRAKEYHNLIPDSEMVVDVSFGPDPLDPVYLPKLMGGVHLGSPPTFSQITKEEADKLRRKK